jgi:hypothetical protein
MVELQAPRSLWLQYRTGGLAWADGICQRKYREYFDVQGSLKDV